MQRFHEAQKLDPETSSMPHLFQPDIFKGLYHVLSEEIGKRKAKTMMMESFMWDLVFDKPEWHPEQFDIKNEEDEEHYKKIFKDLVPFISMFNRLKNEYGEERAQEITAKLAVPSAVPYLAKTFHPIENLTDIDQFRQMLTNYLGDGEGFEWTEEVSDDKTAVHYRFTRCVYIEILRAYGLTQAAAMSCYCDHIIFDNAMPQIYFRRDHCKGVGDSFCDHQFNIRSSEDAYKNDARYGDMDKADFDATGIVQEWADNYQENGGKFSW